MREEPLTAQPEKVAEAGRLYRETDLPVAEIAARLKIGRSRFFQIRRQEGWPLRQPWKSNPMRKTPPGPETSCEPPDRRGRATLERSVAAELVRTARRMHRSLARRLAVLERQGLEADPERAAKAFASYTRSMTDIAKIAAAAPAREDCDDTKPSGRSLEELRVALFGHMRRLRDNVRAARGARSVQRRRA